MLRFVQVSGLGLVVAAAIAASAPMGTRAQALSAPAGIAFLAVDLANGRALASEHPEHLDTPVAPGSVMKIVALAAALESGVVSERTGILCTRQTAVAGHRLTCTHPDLHRPLKPGEALAHSCNVFYASVAGRLSRSAFDRVLSSLGLPPSDPSQSLAAAALGLEGVRLPPRRLLDMMVRLTAEPTLLPWKASTISQVRAALREAALSGSAGALRANHIDALAKTGTVVAGAVAQGLVVGVAPARAPRIGFVLLASGAAGIDAAALAAARLTRLDVGALGPLSNERGNRLSPFAKATEDHRHLAGGGQPAISSPPADGLYAQSRNRSDTSPMVRLGAASPRGGYDVRELPLEEYVAQVVAGESAPGSTGAGLEALAIAARTFAVANRGRHSSDGFDLCDLTHCQVLRAAVPASRQAVAATAGSVLLDRGHPAAVFYTASCGGYSERPSGVWRGAIDEPFLPSQRDEACSGEPVWRADLDAGALMRALRAGGFRGDMLRGIAVTSRTASGRVAWLRLDGMTPPEISGENFRTIVGRVLGWQLVKSTAFDVSRTSRGFHLEGHGAGHGVGLCVLGSAALAKSGRSARQILARYYPGLTIGTLAGASQGEARGAIAQIDIKLVLPAADETERAPLTSLVRRTTEALAARLAVSPPATIELKFHPTVESYQRATQQPWFTAAASSSSGIDAQPLAVLRRRGVLETTLAHEIAHLLTAPTLHGRPLWIAEGVAAHFAGEADETGAAVCRDDMNLRRPASAAILKDARARAASCVASRLQSGLAWRDITR